MNSVVNKNKEIKNLKSNLFQRSSGLLNNIINLSAKGRSPGKLISQERDISSIHYENVYSNNFGFNKQTSPNKLNSKIHDGRSRSELDITELKEKEHCLRPGKIPEVCMAPKNVEIQDMPMNKPFPSQSNKFLPSPKNPNVIVLSNRKLHQSTKSLSTSTISSNNSGNSSSVRSQFTSSSKLSLPNTRKSLSIDKSQQNQSGPVQKLSDNNTERTPIWISSIFRLAKKGKLNELKSSLVGLESGLIRHLVDSNGNTLLHVVAEEDNVEAIEWIVGVLNKSNLSEAALKDRNKAGRTVLLTSLKKRSLECLKWLVENTVCGEEEFLPSDGKQSLLHFAARYDNTEAIGWLSQKICSRNLSVDIRDSFGQTPLHVSAQFGNINASHFLIRFGADPFCKTELGLKPLDLARRYCRLECSHYFIMVETAGSLGKELKDLMELSRISHHYQLLQFHFRDILQVGKLLLKDLIKGSAFPKNPESPDSSSLLLGCGSPPNTRLAEVEHKLLRAEQSFKELLEINKTIKISEEMDFLKNDLNKAELTSILQMKMTETESHRDKNTLVEPPTYIVPYSTERSDEDSTCSLSSGDDDAIFHMPHSYQYVRQSNGWRKDGSGHVPITSFKESLSSSSKTKITGGTPWLLSENDSTIFPSTFLIKDSGSIQPLKNFDLLQSPCFKNSSGLSQHGLDVTDGTSLQNMPIKIDNSNLTLSNTKTKQVQSPPKTQVLDASVLEVIEPNLKQINLAPDLIQGASSIYTPPSMDSHQSECRSDSSRSGSRHDHLERFNGQSKTSTVQIQPFTKTIPTIPIAFSSSFHTKSLNGNIEQKNSETSNIQSEIQDLSTFSVSVTPSFSQEMTSNSLIILPMSNGEYSNKRYDSYAYPKFDLPTSVSDSVSIDDNDDEDERSSIAPSETSKTESTIATAIQVRCVGGEASKTNEPKSNCAYAHSKTNDSASSILIQDDDLIPLKRENYCIEFSNEPSTINSTEDKKYSLNPKTLISENEKLQPLSLFTQFNSGKKKMIGIDSPNSITHFKKQQSKKEEESQMQKAWYEVDGSEGSDDESSLLGPIPHSPSSLSSQHSRTYGGGSGVENESNSGIGNREDEELLGTRVKKLEELESIMN